MYLHLTIAVKGQGKKNKLTFVKFYKIIVCSDITPSIAEVQESSYKELNRADYNMYLE